ncbi:hypothetical protein TEA_018451 [Camellia sinensis var. sinensis]|uniref:Uncharacterized protein n=1 Tax=Camellia sinensis var. sinensis TaxID=542762 RepID=A0A4S4D7I2_CAMSN|nr:hypothetical protein TEA_018451 [Camellia sinensis var. sinensis]
MDFVHQDEVVSSSSSSSECMWCKKQASSSSTKSHDPGGCSYVCTRTKFHFHVYCITEMVHEAWKKGVIIDDSTNDISTALKEMDLLTKFHFHVYCITEMVHEAWKKGVIIDDSTNDISTALKEMDLQLMMPNSDKSTVNGIIETLKTVSPFVAAIVSLEIASCQPDLTQLIGTDPPLRHQWSSLTTPNRAKFRSEYNVRSLQRIAENYSTFCAPRSRT